MKRSCKSVSVILLLILIIICCKLKAGDPLSILQHHLETSITEPMGFSYSTGHRYWDIARNDSCKIEIKSSSDLSLEYKAGNAFDMSLETAWVEGKPDAGIGEWISVKITQNKNTRITIRSIMIVNALVQPQFRNLNNRIKKMEVVFDYGNGNLRKDVVDFPDELTVETVDPLDYDSNSKIVLVKGEPLEIKFIIKEVYPGSKWNDTCIPMIYISGSEMGW